MSQRFLKIALVLVLCFPAISFFAQNAKPVSNAHDDDDDDLEALLDKLEDVLDKTSTLSVNLNYADKVIVLGRDYGLNSYNLAPGLAYKDKSGISIYVNALVWDSLPEVAGRGPRVAETDLGLGYDFKLNKNLSGSIGYEHWFNNYGNDTLQKALTNYISADLSYDLEGFTAGLSGYYVFGKQSGIGTNFSLAKTFVIPKIFGHKDKIAFTPSLTAELANGGVQRPVLIRKVNKQGVPVVSKEGKPVYVRKTTTDKAIAIRDYDFALQVTYAWLGVMDITPALHYMIPENLAAGENIVNGVSSTAGFFYFSIDTKWPLWRKSKPKN